MEKPLPKLLGYTCYQAIFAPKLRRPPDAWVCALVLQPARGASRLEDVWSGADRQRAAPQALQAMARSSRCLGAGTEAVHCGASDRRDMARVACHCKHHELSCQI